MALRLTFVGDDFTGSTDAMESLALEGLQIALFTRPPTKAMLAAHPNLDAFGIATRTRSMPPDDMAAALKPIFETLREVGSPIVHYKICSTFDSSPTVGSIGRAIEVGREVFDAAAVPVLVGVPSLGRYCVFGNLFARYGAGGEVFRLDRHPSISRHPVTPMTEADLRVHLARQTSLPIGLFDIRAYATPDAFSSIAKEHAVVLMDCAGAYHLPIAGSLIAATQFVVGSSGVGQALVAHWRETGSLKPAEPIPAAIANGPVLAVCGSCSPVSVAQVKWAVANGFDEVVVRASTDRNRAAEVAAAALGAGRSVVVHTASDRTKWEATDDVIGSTLGAIAQGALGLAPVRRIAIAGGDTSGRIAKALGIESMKVMAQLTRGAPLVRVTAPDSPADGCELTFKGGQIGSPDFFGQVRDGIRI